MDFDLDAFDGIGSAAFTDNIEEAMVFASPGDLFATVTMTSTVRPLREDGHPNRPLTALTIEAVAVEVELEVPDEPDDGDHGQHDGQDHEDCDEDRLQSEDH